MRKLIPASILCLLAGSAFAQQGDRRGEPQPALPSHWEIPPAPILSPEEELATFQLAEDHLRIGLFASEPMVQDPVAMEFDEDGRLWVVEMRGYMRDIDGTGEDDPIGRVSILEDTDQDGRADKATVFLNGLVLPRAIHVCWGGALVATDGALWFAKDEDGDDVADSRELVDADYIQSGNPEHQPNGLLLGLDNWIYSAKSDRRYRRVDGKWIMEKTEFRGQWGITQDHFGNLYYNVNYSQLHADFFPPNYSLRNPYYTPKLAINHQVTTNQTIFPIRPNTGVNRGYRPGILDERGYLKEFTSASAPHVLGTYQLDVGDEHGPNFDLFVCEPAGNLIKRNRVRSDLGGDKPIGMMPAVEDREFLASTDERFRPVDLATGPDGFLYIADMYRGICQHKQYMTTHLRGEILSRGLDEGIHLGRIWRVRSGAKQPFPTTAMSEMNSEELIGHLDSRSDQHATSTARRLLIERAAASVASRIVEDMVSDGVSAQEAWLLESVYASMDGGRIVHKDMPPDTWKAFVSSVNRERMDETLQLIRVAELFAVGDPNRESELIDAIVAAGLHVDPMAMKHVALTVGGFDHAKVAPMLGAMLNSGQASPLVREAIFCAKKGKEWDLLLELVNSDSGRALPEDWSQMILELSSMLTKQGDSGRIAGLIELAARMDGGDSWKRTPLLNGILANRMLLLRNPLTLAQQPDGLAELKSSPDPLTVAAIEGVSRLIAWPGNEAVERRDARVLPPLTGAFAQRHEQGRDVYMKACASCHGVDGAGLPSLAPPLIDSEWVTRDDETIAKIILHGLEGPITVNGERFAPPRILPNMPPVTSLADTEIASVISFVRREMGGVNRRGTPDLVAIVRNRHPDRQTPWTEEELEMNLSE